MLKGGDVLLISGRYTNTYTNIIQQMYPNITKCVQTSPRYTRYTQKSPSSGAAAWPGTEAPRAGPGPAPGGATPALLGNLYEKRQDNAYADVAREQVYYAYYASHQSEAQRKCG